MYALRYTLQSDPFGPIRDRDAERRELCPRLGIELPEDDELLVGRQRAQSGVDHRRR